MNLSPRWIKLLTESGFEAVHWAAIGAPNAPDIEIMAHAKAHDFVVLTHDLDFSAILAASGGEKPSVVQIRSDDVNPDVIGQSVLDALRQMADALHDGALITVDPMRTRMRVLPLITS